MRRQENERNSVDFNPGNGCNRGGYHAATAWISRLLFVLCLGFWVEGCYTTNLRVESHPPGATVHYDYKPVGTTPVDIPVEWYGKHRLTLDHPDYGRRVETIDLDAPAYLIFPFDFFATIAPAKIKDSHGITIDFTKQETPKAAEEDHGSEGTQTSEE